jgi:hypothetical protein
MGVKLRALGLVLPACGHFTALAGSAYYRIAAEDSKASSDTSLTG